MQKLTKSDLYTELRFQVRSGGFHWFDHTMEQKYQLDFDVFLPSIGKNLQRPFVWTLHQKQQFILSILKGIKIPAISVLIIWEGGLKDKVCQIIDGKQRLGAFMDFANAKFCLPTGHYFDDLDGGLRTKIITFYTDSYQYATFDISDSLTDQDKIDWFSQINFTGTPQDVEHMNSLMQK